MPVKNSNNIPADSLSECKLGEDWKEKYEWHTWTGGPVYRLRDRTMFSWKNRIEDRSNFYWKREKYNWKRIKECQLRIYFVRIGDLIQEGRISLLP